MIPMYDLHVLGLPGSSESPPFLFGAVWAVARLGSVLDGAGGAGRRRLDVPWQDMIFVDVVRRRFPVPQHADRDAQKCRSAFHCGQPALGVRTW